MGALRILQMTTLVCLALLVAQAVCQDDEVPELSDGLRSDRKLAN